MEWYVVLSIFIVALILIFISGLPIAVSFMVVNAAFAIFFWGPTVGFGQLVKSMQEAVTTFVLLPIPFFILMGEVMFLSGLAPDSIDALDKIITRVPGRLAILAVAGGVMLATFTGASTASAAVLGSALVPEMLKRNYKSEMVVGPILAGGLLAPMIPPTATGIFLCAVAEISVAKTLVAIIIPGLLMSFFYVAYIVIRCYHDPSLAPSYETEPIRFSEKLKGIAYTLLPTSLLIFAVIGLIFLGIATPTEAAGVGVLATFVLAITRGRFKWKILRESTINTVRIAGMLLLIISGGIAFSQIMSYSGASNGLVGWVGGFQVSPLMIVGMMMVVMVFLGFFIDGASIMLITLPIFMPIIKFTGLDPVWFAVIVLINMEVGLVTPPFGLLLYVMRGVVPKNITLTDIIKGALPFVLLSILSIILVMLLPQLALFLPSLMSK